MKKIILILWLLSISLIQAHEQNLIIIVDTLHQESAEKEDVTATHQLITALQQQAAPVLASVSLWKNIIDRKQEFAKKLEHALSIESEMYDLYQQTNKELQSTGYDVKIVNEMLSESWYEQHYAQLAALSEPKLNQLKFNFFCYTFNFDMQKWSVFDAQAGMLLFIPVNNSLQVNASYQITKKSDLVKHADKKCHVLQSLQKFLDSNKDQWVIYVSGHGHPESYKQKAHIAGMKIEEFSQFLSFLNNKLQTKLLVYSSCYAGGLHAMQPYKDRQLKYTVIVTALTDAPIYGFGLFEGLKLPPYDVDFNLEPYDIEIGIGVKSSKIQQFDAFFKRAWHNLFDLQLIEFVSQFFTCKSKQCSLQKIENMPLIRVAGSSVFIPLSNNSTAYFVRHVTTSDAIMTDQPLLLSVKKIKKIKIDAPIALVSMLPGLQGHEIGQLDAHSIPLSDIIKRLFLSLSDAQRYKNYLIHSLSCYNDLIYPAKQDIITHCMIVQYGLMPKFFDKKAQTLVIFKSDNDWYLCAFHDQKISSVMILTQEQIAIVLKLEDFMQKTIDFQDHLSSKALMKFDAYQKNKLHQQDVIQSCLHQKVCRKW